MFKHDFRLVPQFINTLEEELLIKACLWKLKRSCGSKYLTSHFDGVIKGPYRECTAQHWGPYDQSVNEILDRCKDYLMTYIDQKTKFLIPHILELKDETSYIDHHVDHLQASGSMVAGLCLNSCAIAEFKNESSRFKVLLNRKCFYFQKDSIRYQYTHAITKESQWMNEPIQRGQRFTILLRNQP